MKKLLGISIVAVLAVTPLMANADPVSVTLQGTNGVVAASNDVASTSYVKGAYNALGEKINSLGTTVGDANSGLVKKVAELEASGQHLTAGDGIEIKDGNKITVKPTATGSGLSVTSDGVAVSGVAKTQLATGVQTSLGLADSALQKADIITGTENGTISVDGTDVAVKGLGSAAYKADTDFDTAGAAAGVKSDIEGKLDDGATGYDINAKSLQVKGANVLTENSSLGATNIADKAITKAKLDDGVQASLGLADSALQKADIITGTENGTISVDGTDVAVKGLGSAAYKADTDFDAAGAATAAETAAKTYADQKVVTVHTTWTNYNATDTVALTNTTPTVP